MTPKEKAKELIKKFALLHRGEEEKDWINRNIVFDYLDKECALIAVNEILNNFLSNRTTNYGRERYHFWQKVKLEIYKL